MRLDLTNLSGLIGGIVTLYDFRLLPPSLVQGPSYDVVESAAVFAFSYASSIGLKYSIGEKSKPPCVIITFPAFRNVSVAWHLSPIFPLGQEHTPRKQVPP